MLGSRKMNIGNLEIGDFLAIGAIFSATDSVCTLQVLSQDETPLLYSLVFGEGVVNDATSSQASTDEVAIMTFMAYLSYLLAEHTFATLSFIAEILYSFMLVWMLWTSVEICSDSLNYQFRSLEERISFITKLQYGGLDLCEVPFQWLLLIISLKKVFGQFLNIMLAVYQGGHTQLNGKCNNDHKYYHCCPFQHRVFGLMTKPLIRLLLPHQNT
ncbi:monovalent cation:H+ antiporter, CPA1 (nhx1) [Datura stramonium]|uniref:Monovalent cation:H+ antiporter, CPA1 (Nhx1) n=1 Tax=Datura stramonium TaxID=4076 RepID=A0ABS8WS47_DATST|nr:monovalent cation:H+ antiporter, CPA1 (nhx1) [Datura stramonium]